MTTTGTRTHDRPSIDGRRTDATGGDSVPVLDPATGRVPAVVARGGAGSLRDKPTTRYAR